MKLINKAVWILLWRWWWTDVMEEHAVEGYKRINDTRTDQLLAPAPEMVITNCPFCLTMIDDGVKGAGAEEKTKVFDVAEVLWQTMQ